jgi:hypothetical protein
MYNRLGIWASQLRNTEFQSVFLQTGIFSLKPLDFELKFKFL